MGHYFINQDDLNSDKKEHVVLIKDKKYSFITDHGVFSKKGLDFGSRLLIESTLDLNFDHALDMGCGYGPIGIILKSFNFKAKIDMVDVNHRAIELAKENARNNRVTVNVFESDGFSKIENQYDLIVTNPPIRTGKKTIYKMFEDAKTHLTKNGSLFIVIQKKQGAMSAFKFCQNIYRHVDIVNKKSGYVIIKCCL
ncbi:class I SAM-dependent methyltransferase [Mycoplasmatota bacterium]|nr:class I SAM-dependent methyltransferase [Mycoplasmatota bacterium]